MKTKMPKYLVVENRIEKAIHHRTFGDKIPGERMLAKKFEVSYMTLRKAIENLVTKGLLYKIPSRGTYVVDLEQMNEEKGHKRSKSDLPNSESCIDTLKHSSLAASEIKSNVYPCTFQKDDKSLTELRQEVNELRRANQVLQKVAAYYAGALSPN